MGPHTLDRITINPAIMNGQPCIRGMRLTVRRVIEALALFSERAGVKREYPELEDDDITQALEFAALFVDEPFCPSTRSNASDGGQATRLGFLKDQVQVPEDFDSMGSKEIEQLFGKEP
jgi:uncharacterized protein (DUF433 family)